MKNDVSFPVLPDLSAIDFSCIKDVRNLTSERFQSLFGHGDDGYINRYMQAIDDLFSGRQPGYQAIDTDYHNITHTLQATLCLVELLHNRQFNSATPLVDVEDFKRALVAVLFHDVGYLKKAGDNEGTGAKYTHLHEQRSSIFAREYLSGLGWKEDDIQFVENLISATGPSADVTRVGYRSEIERIMGQTICTADYIGQMSDPHYPEKLEVLFGEFRESYQYQQIPHDEWPFASYKALLRGTPAFWNTFVQNKLTVECGGISKYLKNPVNGKNPYMEAVDRNLVTIERMIAEL